MSAEPESAVIATVRRFIELFVSGDYDEAVSMLDEDIVLKPAGSQPAIHGRAGLRAWMEPETLAHPKIALPDFEVEGDKVLVFARGHSRGIQSGVEIDWQGWALFTFGPNGKPIRIDFFLGHEEEAARTALKGV